MNFVEQTEDEELYGIGDPVDGPVDIVDFLPNFGGHLNLKQGLGGFEGLRGEGAYLEETVLYFDGNVG